MIMDASMDETLSSGIRFGVVLRDLGSARMRAIGILPAEEEHSETIYPLASRHVVFVRRFRCDRIASSIRRIGLPPPTTGIHFQTSLRQQFGDLRVSRRIS
jgi:hypothetical protein